MAETAEGLGIYSFPGGNVTFDGVSLGATATYNTDEDYRVDESQTFISICGKDSWILPSAGIAGGRLYGMTNESTECGLLKCKRKFPFANPACWNESSNVK